MACSEKRVYARTAKKTCRMSLWVLGMWEQQKNVEDPFSVSELPGSLTLRQVGFYLFHFHFQSTWLPLIKKCFHYIVSICSPAENRLYSLLMHSQHQRPHHWKCAHCVIGLTGLVVSCFRWFKYLIAWCLKIHIHPALFLMPAFYMNCPLERMRCQAPLLFLLLLVGVMLM